MIYKYRDWKNDNHKKILTEFELFFASPKSFNDPFDTKIFFDYENMSDEDYVNFKERIYSGILNSKLRFHNNKDLLNNYLDNKNNVKELSKKVETAAADNMMGIISFSTDLQNILLWSHYANNHNGFAVGFDKEKIENSNLMGAGAMVIYQEDRNHPFLNPMDDPIDLFFNKTYVKSIDWKYESEYRVLRIFKEKLDPDHQQRKVQFDPELITEVCLGLDINETNKENINQICNNLKIPVFQMKKVHGKFEIQKVRCT